jgi:signal transduction histidine kinase
MQGGAARTKANQGIKACPTPPRFAGEMLSVLSGIMSVEPLERVLHKIASTVAELYSVRRLHISVLDETDQAYRIRAAFGFTPEQERKIRKMKYSLERMRGDQAERYKIADNVYFVRPGPEEFVKGEEVFYTNIESIKKPRTDPNLWHELDYLKLVFNDRTGKPIGYIEVSEFNSSEVPDRETVQSMEIFAELAGVAIENAKIYQKQVEIAQRSLFLGNVIAHDINNYNQAVTSYLQMALTSKLPEKVSGYLERASSSAWGISGLIQKANKLMKIESEGAENVGPLELGEILRESIAEVGRENTDSAVKFNFKVDKRYFVLGNELVTEVFTNVLQNAIDYDPHENIAVDISIGEFTIEPRRYWCVSIADNGIGIPDSKKNLVFGRLRSGEEGAPSAGLGLSIVRAIVEAHRGIVWVEDRVQGEPSKGSIFRVALPMTTVR